MSAFGHEFEDQIAAAMQVRDAGGNLVEPNTGLFKHSVAAPRLEASRIAHESANLHDLERTFDFLLSNGPNREPQPKRNTGWPLLSLVDLWIKQGRGNVELEAAVRAYGAYLSTLADGGYPVHCVQIFTPNYLTNGFDNGDRVFGPPTAVKTWPVPLLWTPERVALSLITSGHVECWFCGFRTTNEVDGLSIYVPVSFGGVTKVFPTCGGCEDKFDRDLTGGLQTITVEEATRHRRTAYPSDAKRPAPAPNPWDL